MGLFGRRVFWSRVVLVVRPEHGGNATYHIVESGAETLAVPTGEKERRGGRVNEGREQGRRIGKEDGRREGLTSVFRGLGT